MKLPIAIQNSLDRSERELQKILERLGLDRNELARVAERIRA